MEEELRQFKLEHILNGFPENYAIYKDSGIWNIIDDSDEWIATQRVDESLKAFLVRFIVENDLKDCIIDIAVSVDA